MTNPDQNENEPLADEDVWSDPVVEEVREIRRRLWEEAGGDVREYIRRVRASAEQARREQVDKAGEAA